MSESSVILGGIHFVVPDNGVDKQIMNNYVIARPEDCGENPPFEIVVNDHFNGYLIARREDFEWAINPSIRGILRACGKLAYLKLLLPLRNLLWGRCRVSVSLSLHPIA